MFATEPMMIRLPAKVVDSASTFHINSGSLKRSIHLPATITNGTLEKMFEPAAESHARFQLWVDTVEPKTVGDADKLRRANRCRLIHRQRQRAPQKIEAGAN